MRVHVWARLATSMLARADVVVTKGKHGLAQGSTGMVQDIMVQS
jgi:hypothetical protein